MYLQGIPFWGKMATYGGGGYVANLGTTRGQALSLLDDLLETEWIDFNTRAIFVEFTVYNPNINIFAYVSFLFESPATGAFIPNPKVMPFKLYTRVTSFTTTVVACQIIYMIMICEYCTAVFARLQAYAHTSAKIR